MEMTYNLMYRGQQIPVIRSLKYSEMKYWNGWHEIMAKEERSASERLKGDK